MSGPSRTAGPPQTGQSARLFGVFTSASQQPVQPPLPHTGQPWPQAGGHLGGGGCGRGLCRPPYGPGPLWAAGDITPLPRADKQWRPSRTPEEGDPCPTCSLLPAHPPRVLSPGPADLAGPGLRPALGGPTGSGVYTGGRRLPEPTRGPSCSLAPSWGHRTSGDSSLAAGPQCESGSRLSRGLGCGGHRPLGPILLARHP